MTVIESVECYSCCKDFWHFLEKFSRLLMDKPEKTDPFVPPIAFNSFIVAGDWCDESMKRCLETYTPICVPARTHKNLGADS